MPDLRTIVAEAIRKHARYMRSSADGMADTAARDLEKAIREGSFEDERLDVKVKD